MKKIVPILFLYFAVIFALFFYSYTQVDLSLTLSKASFYQTVEKGFQYIGYFNRPFSTAVYCVIVSLLFLFYLLFLQAPKKIFIGKSFWILLFAISIVLTFSYNAFSYDLFNYIFAAKEVVFYHQNPYILTALDFPKDPMLSFMHWTHNTYQYGFIWLLTTLPFYFLGFGFFLPTFYLFKMLLAGCFLGSVYFFQKIAQKVTPERQLEATIFYAFNPLVIIELLVSSHNDSIMMFLGLVGVYLILEKKWILGILALILSALTKEVTVLLFIPTAVYFVSELVKKKFYSNNLFLWSSAFLMLAGFMYAGWKLGIQPWYAVWFLPFFFLLKLPRWVYALLIGFSLGLLLRYVPFLWQGDWNGMALVIMPIVTFVTPVVFLILAIIVGSFRKI